FKETVDNDNDSAVLDKVSKARDESNGFESKKSSKGKGFEVSNVYVKESIEVKNGLVDGFVVEVVTSLVLQMKVKNKSLFLPNSSLNNSWEVINESCKENRNTCGDSIKVNLRKNRTLDGVVMDGEPVFVKANKECFIEMTLDPQGRMQTAREKDDLELEYWNEIVYKCMGKSKGEFISSTKLVFDAGGVKHVKSKFDVWEWPHRKNERKGAKGHECCVRSGAAGLYLIYSGYIRGKNVHDGVWFLRIEQEGAWS
ncbi:hypothetical protein Tco_1083451, partial [Tanacetum coccineum]